MKRWKMGAPLESVIEGNEQQLEIEREVNCNRVSRVLLLLLYTPLDDDSTRRKNTSSRIAHRHRDAGMRICMPYN